MSMRETVVAQKSLVCLLQTFEGKSATVELRDETTVSGKVLSVDGYMNIEMSGVTYTAPSGVSTEFDAFCCQGKFIRFVQMPDIDVIEGMKERLSELARIANSSRGRGGGRGGFRGRGGRRGGGRPFRRGGGGFRGGSRSGGGHYSQDRRYRGGSSSYERDDRRRSRY